MANVINTHYYVKVLQMQAILMEGRITEVRLQVCSVVKVCQFLKLKHYKDLSRSPAGVQT